jgi:surfeit locus 1 family protein
LIRKLLWPSLMTAIMLIVLLGLGTWQMRRLAWKEAILAQITNAEIAPPVPLPPAPTSEPAQFAKVAVTGSFMHDKAAIYGADVHSTRTGPELGAALIEPLQRDGAVAILVDRGWVPLKRMQPVAMPDGKVTVVGFVYPGVAPGLFSARDDVAARHFYTLDPAAIGAALGLAHVAPFILVAVGPPPAPGADIALPIPAEHLPQPPNNHLQYAITWYGLAGALVVIFAVWARKAARA